MKVNSSYLAIGRRLVELRSGKGLNQSQAAESLGIKHTTYQKYEYGLSKPNTKNFNTIVNFYRCSPGWLLAGEGEPFPSTLGKRPWSTNSTSKWAEAPDIKPSTSVIYLSPAHRVLDEAIREADVTLNEAQKAALLRIIQDELSRTGDKVLEIIRVFKKGDDDDRRVEEKSSGGPQGLRKKAENDAQEDG
jgi:transcriptional regulator with XRE-family HTH domain